MSWTFEVMTPPSEFIRNMAEINPDKTITFKADNKGSDASIALRMTKFKLCSISNNEPSKATKGRAEDIVQGIAETFCDEFPSIYQSISGGKKVSRSEMVIRNSNKPMTDEEKARAKRDDDMVRGPGGALIAQKDRH